ncbi:helicase HerA-like domain-containing protein [Nakamurella lactea]|uniref:helicase HerA-like domain-containing protein n=1 Tax=Nakamurella lactea TaxID=459515 RepID=UPI0004110567|nr:helicase HerA-like domain-containing protein [Nakamurella lactea]
MSEPQSPVTQPAADAPNPAQPDAAAPPDATALPETTVQTEGGTEATARIGHGYDTDSPVVTLGSVIVDGTCDPSALVRIPLAMFNRHGLVAGATGTGKTKTLQVIAEQLSAAGVPVLMPDIKGDLSGLAAAGSSNDKIVQRAKDTGDDWQPGAFPVEFLALAGGGTGVPIRASIDSFGPILLSKVLGLNDTQESTLGLIFHWADTQKLPLLDIKDLREVIQYLTSDQGKADLKNLGGVSSATAGVILRAVTNLEAQGGDRFFGEPQLDVADLIRTDASGKGIISLLEVTDLQNRPGLFSTFVMWLLAELFEHLPEVGDADKPKIVFMFDESHLLFADASKAFLQAVEQTVKLIRSKGVGVFFCTQLPTDVPDAVLSQLGARVQHALRAFTPNDQKALSKTVKTYPNTTDYDLEKALTSLGTGEAIVTVLSEKGAPTPVAWTRVRAPRSLMAPATQDTVSQAITRSPLNAKYGVAVDRESAYEMLSARLAAAAGDAAATTDAAEPQQPKPAPASDDGGFIGGILHSQASKSFLRSLGTALGGALGRSIFGTRKRR